MKEDFKTYESKVWELLRNYPLLKFGKRNLQQLRRMHKDGMSVKDAAGLMVLNSKE